MSQAKKEVYQILFDDEYAGIITKLEPGAIPLQLNYEFLREFRENNFGESPCFQLANDFLAFSYRGEAQPYFKLNVRYNPAFHTKNLLLKNTYLGECIERQGFRFENITHPLKYPSDQETPKLLVYIVPCIDLIKVYDNNPDTHNKETDALIIKLRKKEKKKPTLFHSLGSYMDAISDKFPDKTINDFSEYKYEHQRKNLDTSGICIGLNSYKYDTIQSSFDDRMTIDLIYMLYPGTNKVCSILIAQLGECSEHDLNHLWTVRLICNAKGDSTTQNNAAILIGAYCWCLRKIKQQYGLLELAGGYGNMAGYCLYAKFGFREVGHSFRCSAFTKGNVPMMNQIFNDFHSFDDISNTVIKNASIKDGVAQPKIELCKKGASPKKIKAAHATQLVPGDRIFFWVVKDLSLVNSNNAGILPEDFRKSTKPTDYKLGKVIKQVFRKNSNQQYDLTIQYPYRETPSKKDDEYKFFMDESDHSSNSNVNKIKILTIDVVNKIVTMMFEYISEEGIAQGVDFTFPTEESSSDSYIDSDDKSSSSSSSHAQSTSSSPKPTRKKTLKDRKSIRTIRRRRTEGLIGHRTKPARINIAPKPLRGTLLNKIKNKGKNHSP